MPAFQNLFPSAEDERDMQDLAVGGLQPGPVQVGSRAQPTPESTLQPTAPALAPPPQEEEPGPTAEIAEAKKMEVAEQSVEAAKTATPEDKAEMNKAIEDMGVDLETAYNEALVMLGGEKEVPGKFKMEREDWGLFLMDFGMRMMAASGQSNAQTGGSAGMAGAGALQGALGRHAAEQGTARDYNENLQDRALDFAGDRVGRQDKSREGKNIVWTEKGAFNMQTRQYERDPETGGVLKPGITPGQGNRQFARSFSADALVESGLSRSQADKIAHGGSPTKETLRFEYGKRFDELKSKGGRAKFPDGKGGEVEMRWKDAGEAERRRWIDSRVRDIWPDEPAAGPALTQPGPAAGGRKPPNEMNKKY